MSLLHKATKEVSLAVATSNAAIYGSGDQIGVVMKVTDALLSAKGMAFLRGIVIMDNAKQKAPIDIFFFNAAPTNAVLDNAAADISDAEMLKCVGHVSVLAAEYAEMANSALATKPNLGLLLKGATLNSKDLWMLCVSRGTPTYGSVQDLTVKLTLEQC